jgi:hypothetical protein
MPLFLVRVDVVNLVNVFGDCNDLSTIRGGGLAVLDIGEVVARGLPAGLNTRVVTSGASQAMLEIQAESEENIRAEIGYVTKSNPVLKHVTVLVAANQHGEESTFQDRLAKLTARIRWEQMKGPSIIYPEVGGARVCLIDKVRPTRRLRSSYTAARQQYGRRQRSELLRTLLDGIEYQGVSAPRDFEQLVGPAGTYGNLAGKMAVLRFDGNGFGQMFRECESQDRYQELSAQVQRQQRAFFRRLLLDGTNGRRAGWWGGDGSTVNLEILVFGGDEVSFVVPAHLGWDALRAFYEHVEADGATFSYAGAIVFCHHNAPIHAIRELASDLVDLAKPGNTAHYLTLESFDQLGEPAEDYLARRYRFASGSARGRLSAEAIRSLDDGMESIKRSVSKKRLHGQARALTRRREAGRMSDDVWKATVTAMMEYRGGASEQGTAALDKIRASVDGDTALLHVLDLWDYVRPVGDAPDGAVGAQ